MELPQSSLFNKKAADDAVIASLQRHIRKLNKELQMIVKTTNGDYYRVEEDDKLTEVQVQEIVAKKQAELQALEAIAPSTAAPAAGTEQQTTAAPADQTQAQAAPVDPAAATNSGTAAAPADPTAAPANGAPANGQAAPAADANSVTLQ